MILNERYSLQGTIEPQHNQSRRFEVPPERCALLERRCVQLLDRVRGMMDERYRAHVAFERRLEEGCQRRADMRQHVGKRRNALSLYTATELQRWFESSGYTMPDLRKTEEREAARTTHDETCAKLQSHLQRLTHEFQLGVAQRCRGWTPQT